MNLAFRPTFVALGSKTKKSSTEWLRRQSQDPFVKQRNSILGGASGKTKINRTKDVETSAPLHLSTCSPSSFRSRSAFKLFEIEEKYDFLTKPDVRVVVDLGAAPGGWSQVVRKIVDEAEIADTEGGDVTAEGVDEREELDRSKREEEENENDTFRRKSRIRKPKNFQPKSTAPKPSLDSYDPVNIDDADFEHHSSSPVKIVAVDRLAMDPIPGVYTLKADFLHPQTNSLIGELIRGPQRKLTLTSSPPKVDIILSDIAHNITGHSAVDSEANLIIADAVLHFTRRYLRTADEIGRVRGGVLVLKHFAHPTMDTFRRDVLERCFRDVIYTKPKASRQESGEGYFICRGYRGEYFE